MTIQKEMIITVALQLLREHGLDGVTLRKVMKHLQVQAPAIYWRFKEKREMLEAMAEAILQEQLEDLLPYQRGGESWQIWFISLLNRLRAAMLAYPDGARVITGARPQNAPTLALIPEYALRALEAEGIESSAAATIVFTALHYTFGHVIEEQESADKFEKDDTARHAFYEAYPAISRLFSYERTPTDVYNAGLHLIIMGDTRSGQE